MAWLIIGLPLLAGVVFYAVRSQAASTTTRSPSTQYDPEP